MLPRELKSIRIKMGYTQKTLAEKLNMSETSYSKRENGIIIFSVCEVKKLKEILELDDEDILRIFFDDSVAFDATYHN
ncbi:helix-turn-helix domain-containing protein [Sporosalibacterium faouarense]|uniref:helix-turn-helix domain-containing protein n=1 Tax=Sporosalibacterium faouarense TaxID=516123 RepID=UPI00192C10ED|nr:helix-turn-helix transcriptional regulator [Sporosalibacterium faouarense]